MLEKALKARLILEDGTVHKGRAFGHLKECVGEVIFTTGIAGYQESITDPAYAGKILVWTNPLVGNYGLNIDDFESAKVMLKGMVMREKCDFPNNFRCEMDMDGYFKQKRIIGLEGVDTRALTKHITKHGALKGIIDVRGDLTQSQIKQKFDSLNDRSIVRDVTSKEPYIIEGDGKSGHIAVLDLGITKTTLNDLKKRFLKITVFPAFTNYDDIKQSGAEGLFVSGGAGSPFDLPSITETVKKFIGDMPVFGVLLGCLVIANACGCTLKKMKFGHHGCACPIKSVDNGRLYITQQMHEYDIIELSGDTEATFRNINDKTVEGIKHKSAPAFGVLFEPQTNSNSTNTGFVYDTFANYVNGGNISA